MEESRRKHIKFKDKKLSEFFHRINFPWSVQGIILIIEQVLEGVNLTCKQQQDKYIPVHCVDR